MLNRSLPVLFLVAAFLFPDIAPAQQPSSSQALALSVLQSSVAAMGGSPPADSVASGSVTTAAGSLTENGAIVILTRGSDQTSEQLQTPSGNTTVYSHGNASQVQGTTVTPQPLELAVTAQSAYFPLQLFTSAVNDPDSAFSYVGVETINNVSAHHVRYWKAFASSPQLATLASFSTRDVWIDTVSNLPIRVAYSDHAGDGAVPAVSIEVIYSNYQAFNGVLYPLTIQKSVNGTPWAAITLSSVVFNTGLTDANFPLE